MVSFNSDSSDHARRLTLDLTDEDAKSIALLPLRTAGEADRMDAVLKPEISRARRLRRGETGRSWRGRQQCPIGRPAGPDQSASFGEVGFSEIPIAGQYQNLGARDCRRRAHAIPLGRIATDLDEAPGPAMGRPIGLAQTGRQPTVRKWRAGGPIPTGGEAERKDQQCDAAVHGPTVKVRRPCGKGAKSRRRLSDRDGHP